MLFYDFNVFRINKDDLLNKKKLIIGLIEGIEYIHSLDFIHRDIKPSNILMKKINNEFVPKIGDFGQGIIIFYPAILLFL